MTKSLSDLMISNNDDRPLSAEEHLSRLIDQLVRMMGVAFNKGSNEFYPRHLKILLAASKRVRDYLVLAVNDPMLSIDLSDMGGEVLYRELAFEMREWVYTHEPKDIRDLNGRSEDKMSNKHDDIYLSELYDLLIDTFKRAYIGMKRKVPSLSSDQITLGMYRDYLLTGEFQKPLVKPSVLIERYRNEILNFEISSNEAHKRLGSAKSRTELVDLELILDEGIVGIRDRWRENYSLVERIRLEYLGIPVKKEEVFRQSFMSKIRRAQAKGEDSDDERFYIYLKVINDFLCKIASSAEYIDTPELLVAIDAFLTKRRREEREKKKKSKQGGGSVRKRRK